MCFSTSFRPSASIYAWYCKKNSIKKKKKPNDKVFPKYIFYHVTTSVLVLLKGYSFVFLVSFRFSSLNPKLQSHNQDGFPLNFVCCILCFLFFPGNFLSPATVRLVKGTIFYMISHYLFCKYYHEKIGLISDHQYCSKCKLCLQLLEELDE